MVHLVDYVALGGICVGAVWKILMNDMAKQVASWREKERLAEIAANVVVEQRTLAGWNVPSAQQQNDLTFLDTSIDDMNEAQCEYEQNLATAVFESTKQLLTELICRMRTHRSRIVSRLEVIIGMEHSLLEMLDETGHAKWAEMLLKNGVRRFSNLAGFEGVGVLVQHLPGLTIGEASELIVESRERLAVRQSYVQGVPVVGGLLQ